MNGTGHLTSRYFWPLFILTHRMKFMVPVLSLFLFLVLISLTWLNSCSTSVLLCKTVNSPSTPVHWVFDILSFKWGILHSPNYYPVLIYVVSVCIRQIQIFLKLKCFFHLSSLSSSNSCCRNLIASPSAGPWIFLLLHGLSTKSERSQQRMGLPETSFSLGLLVT